MANEMITELPTVVNSSLTDIIYAVQGYSSPSSPGTSVQETLAQVFALMLANTILNHAGNPNGSVAGTTYQLCWDTSGQVMYVCTTAGTSSTAVWTALPPGAGITPPSGGGTGVANPTAHTLPVAEGASNFSFIGPLTDGQFLVGTTGSNPVAGTIAGTSGITAAYSAGTWTLSASGSGIGWNVVTSSGNMSPESGYITNSASLVTLTLPVTAAVGTALAVANLNTGGFTIAQNASQNIRIGTGVTTTGAGGSISSSAQGDSVFLICVVANTTWMTIGGVQGNLTIV